MTPRPMKLRTCKYILFIHSAVASTLHEISMNMCTNDGLSIEVNVLPVQHSALHSFFQDSNLMLNSNIPAVYVDSEDSMYMNSCV